MENIVAVIQRTDKIEGFKELLQLSEFDKTLEAFLGLSQKTRENFKIIIKPNMMTYTNARDHEYLVTDKDLVESLVDHLLASGFKDIVVCEADNDGGTMLKYHNVENVAGLIGYNPQKKYRLVNLSNEALPHCYPYKKNGKYKLWKDEVGKSWKEADFRITFAKCKTHEHDWLTLGVKNVYGCFPTKDMVKRYHIKYEIFDVTARILSEFPVHFSFIDAWRASDGPEGFKVPHPRDLKMLFGGNEPVAVDMEVFKRAGLDPEKSKFLKKAVEHIEDRYGGTFPQYQVRGDSMTFKDVFPDWTNISDEKVEKRDRREEFYPYWGLFNLKVAAKYIDYKTFPGKNLLLRIVAWILRRGYQLLKAIKKIFK